MSVDSKQLHNLSRIYREKIAEHNVDEMAELPNIKKDTKMKGGTIKGVRDGGRNDLKKPFTGLKNIQASFYSRINL